MLASACDGGDDAGSTTLARGGDWVRIADEAEDVWGAQRPDGLTCDEVLGLLAEGEGDDAVLEVNTDSCDWATVRQPTLMTVAPGDTVTIRVSHEELTAPMPTEGYVGLAIDGEVVWEATEPIPSEPGMVEGEYVADRELPAGVELQYHVHNHGVNTWRLLELGVAAGEGGR